MSKVAIKGNASGTGTFTLEAPNSNTDRTLVLPDEAGTVLTSASDIVASQLPAGSVLQVVSNSTQTRTINSTTTYADATDLSASITPSSASSKILVIISANIYVERNTNSAVAADVNVLRGSTSIEEFVYAADVRAAVSGDGYITAASQSSYVVLDSPNTTDSTTYKLQCKINSLRAGFVYINVFPAESTSTITLMEIAG